MHLGHLLMYCPAGLNKGTGIIVAVLNLVLKRAEREEQAMMTTLAGLIVVLVVIIDEIGDLFDKVKSVFGLW